MVGMGVGAHNVPDVTACGLPQAFDVFEVSRARVDGDAEARASDDANAPHDPDDIEFALVWQYPPGALKRYRNLRLVSSLGAGIDHLLRDPEFPLGVPFVRLVDPTLTSGMVEYALAATLRYHRQMVEYAGFQAQAQWHPLPAPTTSQRRVGVQTAGMADVPAAAAAAAHRGGGHEAPCR
jgi:glyoxylate/hydroxypyruvate reductase A